MHTLRKITRLFVMTIEGWNRSDAMLHSAAIAFYALFSLAPLLILSISLASLWFNRATVELQIVARIGERLGELPARVVQEIILNSHDLASGGVATLVGVAFLLYGASGVFSQLQSSLNAMWDVVPRSATVSAGVLAVVRNRLISLGLVLVVGAYLVLSLVFTALWTALPVPVLAKLAAWLDLNAPYLRYWLSPLIFTAIFAFVFKLLPEARVRWRDVLPGAALTGALMWLGSFLIGLYLSRTLTASLYGAAASAAVLLLWTYYSAWIVLFGAKFTQIYAAAYGVPIVPATDDP